MVIMLGRQVSAASVLGNEQEGVSEEIVVTPHMHLPFKFSSGKAFPLGVSEVENGINFAIFSQHASAVTLCLSVPERRKANAVKDDIIEIDLDPGKNKTGDIWHISVEDLPKCDVLYGYRIDGPRKWEQGHRFDSNIILLDPYAKLVDGRKYFGDTMERFSPFYGTYDFSSMPFDWGSDYKLPNIPETDLVIYEMSVRSFTADESSGLDQKVCGSYLGVIEKDLQTERWIGSRPESDSLYCLSSRKELDACAYFSATIESSYL